MGMCLPCLGGAADDVVVTPDPDTRRQQLAEAAEKRQKEIIVHRAKTTVGLFINCKTALRETLQSLRLDYQKTTYRGVKNPEAVERKRKKQEEVEKQAMTTSVSGGGGLKWQVG